MWVDGYGEVLLFQPLLLLDPASNQKLLTAVSALEVLGPDARLTTELRLTADGALVVIGGGDPTLRSTGPHSLATLATLVRAAGVRSVTAQLVDESRYDGARRAAGWQDWQIPTYTGPLSAFMVDDNRWRRDPEFLADPALANGDRLRSALEAEGIEVTGGVSYGTADASSKVIGTLQSEPVALLVTQMLMSSDNQTADLLLKEVGRAATGVGSFAAGARAARDVVRQRFCVALVGNDDDGSGLSRADDRSAQEWRTLLQAVRSASWWPILYDGLPVAGRSGTLSSRLRGTAADNDVHAKTGTIIGGAALSGYGTTAGGRSFVFSVIVNGPGAEAAAPAIDELVAAIAADRS